MAKVKSVEKKILNVEGFDVRILHLTGRDVRGDMEGLNSYNFERAAKEEMTVNEWKQGKFHPLNVGFDIEVLLGNGGVAHGGTKLRNVRDSYSQS